MHRHTMDRRSFVAGSAAAAATLATGPASAQGDYPSRPVTFVNPFPPGGATDVVGRPFAASIEPFLKQPAVVDTKPGAAGAVGAQVVATAKPDGYTLLLHIVSISGFAEVDRQFGREPKFTRDSFIPIARFTEGPMVIVTNDQQPIEVAVASAGKPRALLVGAYSRGAQLDLKTIQASAGQPATVQLRPSSGAGGVYRITHRLPWALDHVHCYALAGASGWTGSSRRLRARITWRLCSHRS